jgi:hypothetical protein
MRARKAGAAPPGAPGSTSSRKPLTRRNVGRGLFGCVRWRTAVGDRWRASVPNTCANPGVQRSRVRREITGDIHGHAGDPQGAEMSESGEVLRSGFHPLWMPRSARVIPAHAGMVPGRGRRGRGEDALSAHAGMVPYPGPRDRRGFGVMEMVLVADVRAQAAGVRVSGHRDDAVQSPTSANQRKPSPMFRLRISPR